MPFRIQVEITRELIPLVERPFFSSSLALTSLPINPCKLILRFTACTRERETTVFMTIRHFEKIYKVFSGLFRILTLMALPINPCKLKLRFSARTRERVATVFMKIRCFETIQMMFDPKTVFSGFFFVFLHAFI